MKPSLNAREHATVMAALRFWQRHWATFGSDGDYRENIPEQDLATDGGSWKALDAEEIDALCEALNFNSDDDTFTAQVDALGDLLNMLDGREEELMENEDERLSLVTATARSWDLWRALGGKSPSGVLHPTTVLKRIGEVLESPLTYDTSDALDEIQRLLNLPREELR